MAEVAVPTGTDNQNQQNESGPESGFTKNLAQEILKTDVGRFGVAALLVLLILHGFDLWAPDVIPLFSANKGAVAGLFAAVFGMYAALTPFAGRTQPPEYELTNTQVIEGLEKPLLKYIEEKPMKGAGVFAVQRTLSNGGYDIAITGEYDAQTKTAVEDFQRDQGIKVDGVVGPITRARLRILYPRRQP